MWFSYVKSRGPTGLKQPNFKHQEHLSSPRVSGTASGDWRIDVPNVFTPEEREELRARLTVRARADSRIVAAAEIGSAATGSLDRWSDIDLGLAIADGTDTAPVIDDWTGHMERDCGAVHRLDVRRGGVLYRVFLLDSTLQVDLSFWPAAEFRAMGPAFRLLFGQASSKNPWPPTAADELVGLGWLYALHARSSIARGHLWQAEHMVSAVRDQVLALTCVRHGLPAAYARGAARLPPDAVAGLDAGLVRSLDAAELRRAFRVVCAALVTEIGRTKSPMPDTLAPVVASLAE